MRGSMMIAALVCLSLLTGCSRGELVETSQQTFEVTHVKPPKRFYVTLRNVDTGQVFEDVYVAKRCSRWEEVPVGSHLTLTVGTYRTSASETFQHIESPDTICPWS